MQNNNEVKGYRNKTCCSKFKENNTVNRCEEKFR